MDYLLARINTRKKSNMRIVLSDKTIYTNINIDCSHEYDNDYKLHENEWFVINDFKSQQFFKSWISEPFNAAAYNQIQSDEYNGLKFLLAYQDDDKCMYQRLFSGSVFENKTFLSLPIHEQPQLRTDNQLIVINPEPDAVYVISENKLYFKSLTLVKQLFPGIEILYKEATDDEVDAFLQKSFIKLGNGFDNGKVKTQNRRYIKEATSIYEGFSDDEKEELNNYIQAYCPSLPYDSDANNYEISNDNQLKDLLYCILERYYTTAIRKQKRIAHSVDNLSLEQ